MAANVWSSCYDFCFALPNVLKLLNHDFDHNTLSAIVLGWEQVVFRIDDVDVALY
jgi:hypothetical protein